MQKSLIRINTNEEQEYRNELYEHTAERFGVGTKSGGIDAACEFSNQMLCNLERAVEHEDMSEDLAELLSTANVTVEHRLVTDVEIATETQISRYRGVRSQLRWSAPR